MPNRLDKELDALHNEIVKFGALCELAVSNATQALKNNDKTSANSVLELEEQTNKQEREIEGVCLKILLRQHPVAKDLRTLSATLKMITDMERIADQARDIAEIALIMNFSPIKKNLEAMAAASLKMVTDSVDCYVSKSIEDCRSVVEYDNIVDDFYKEIQNDVVQTVSNDTSKTLEGMYILMIAKYFERIADHATNVAEWVEFSITGVHKGVSSL
ncbi:MAG: phosphate signaling complex protein PhoU [Clostridia bacterium]